MVKDVNLIGHLPPFIQEYLEVQKIMYVENPEFQLVEDESEIIKNNQFVKYCNSDGIKRFEDMLGLAASEDDSLESRISKVIARLNESLPYTFKVLSEKLALLCGEDGYVLTPNFKNYELNILVRLPMYGQVDELDYLLGSMIPANLIVNISNELSHSVGCMIYAGGGTVTKKSFTIESKTNSEHTVTGLIMDSAVLVSYLQRTIN